MAAESITDSARIFTEDVVRELLRGVGLSAAALHDSTTLTSSFDSLGLDSLARVEVASRIKDRYAVDIEEELAAETTPGELKQLVDRRLHSASA